MLKKIEIQVLRTYNSYRVPFLAVTMTFCILTACNTSKSLVARIGPPLLFMPFITMYNQHVGMYGVHKQIDTILDDILTSNFADESSQVKRATNEFLQNRSIN